MHELMKLCVSHNVPFYLENPKSSKLWMHPIIRKWVQHKSAHLIEFDYCQFGTEWKKATTILSVGNRNFHTGKSLRCKVTWRDKTSICPKTGKPHTTLAGFVDNKEKGQYKTNKACPYPEEFCEYVAPLIANPSVHFREVRRNPCSCRRKSSCYNFSWSCSVNAFTTRRPLLDTPAKAPWVQSLHEL